MAKIMAIMLVQILALSLPTACGVEGAFVYGKAYIADTSRL